MSKNCTADKQIAENEFKTCIADKQIAEKTLIYYSATVLLIIFAILSFLWLKYKKKSNTTK